MILLRALFHTLSVAENSAARSQESAARRRKSERGKSIPVGDGKTLHM
jgi:hypothetical protein